MHYGGQSSANARLRVTCTPLDRPRHAQFAAVPDPFGRPWKPTSGGGGRVAWPTRPGQQAAVCPPPILEIESGGYRKDFETGPRLSNSLPQREGARLPPGARRASRLLFQGFHPVPGALWGPALQPPDCVRSGPTPCATLETPPGLRGIGRTSTYLMLPRRPVGGLLGVGNHMCWAGRSTLPQRARLETGGRVPWGLFQAVGCRWSSRSVQSHPALARARESICPEHLDDSTLLKAGNQPFLGAADGFRANSGHSRSGSAIILIWERYCTDSALRLHARSPVHMKDGVMQNIKAIRHGAPLRRTARTVVLPLHERSMWSVREWSAMNGISVATAYRWIGKGDLVLSKWRGRSFVTREASDAWRALMAAGAAPAADAEPLSTAAIGAARLPAVAGQQRGGSRDETCSQGH